MTSKLSNAQQCIKRGGPAKTEQARASFLAMTQAWTRIALVSADVLRSGAKFRNQP
jgi:hypothetical protein